MENLATLKLEKIIMQSRERCEILQDHKELREKHENLIEKLCKGQIDGDTFA